MAALSIPVAAADVPISQGEQVFAVPAAMAAEETVV